MYKTIYDVLIEVKGDEHPWPFAGSMASVALNQIKACRDVDVDIMQSEGGPQGLIIPYHAVEYVTVVPTRREMADPVDDNCVVDEGDEGTLTVVATTHLDGGCSAIIFASEALDGQYGPLTFSSEGTEFIPLEDGYSYACLPEMEANESIKVPGLPVGMVVVYESTGETATVPGTLYCSEQK